MKIDSQLLLHFGTVFGICILFYLFDVLRFRNNPDKRKAAIWTPILLMVGYILAKVISKSFSLKGIPFVQEIIGTVGVNIIVRLFPSKGWLFQRRNSDERGTKE